ncbi:MAG: porphobilinogen synthase [Myxococcota bacterium]
MIRPRRLRRTDGLRRLVRETHVRVSDLICPLFVREGLVHGQPIASMPGQQQLALTDLPACLDEIARLGIGAVLVFGVPEKTDERGEVALRETGIVPQALRRAKENHPQLVVMADLCLCGFLSHGHCGVLTARKEKGGGHGDVDVDNDATLRLLGDMAVLYAQAGADVVAPSGMMDGVVRHLRAALDEAGWQRTAILSYAAKLASGFYGPFRDAAHSVPRFGDRRGYQLDPANGREALRELRLDVQEGADALMIKPAGPCLDIVRAARERFDLPLAAYQVSGEYAMLHAAARRGWLDLRSCALESLLAIKRAGGDMIVTYFARECARWLQEESSLLSFLRKQESME